jgi:hypothetical protein
MCTRAKLYMFFLSFNFLIFRSTYLGAGGDLHINEQYYHFDLDSLAISFSSNRLSIIKP